MFFDLQQSMLTMLKRYGKKYVYNYAWETVISTGKNTQKIAGATSKKLYILIFTI